MVNWGIWKAIRTAVLMPWHSQVERHGYQNISISNCISNRQNWISSIHPPRHWQTRLYRYTATFEDLLVFDNNFEHVCREFNFCLSCRFAQIAFSSVQSQKLTELASLNSRSWRMATLERTLNSRKWQIPRKEANPWTCIAVLEREWNWGDLAHWPCNAGRWIHCVHECPQLATRRNLTFATQMIFSSANDTSRQLSTVLMLGRFLQH